MTHRLFFIMFGIYIVYRVQIPCIRFLRKFARCFEKFHGIAGLKSMIMNLLEKNLLRCFIVCAVALLPSWASQVMADEPAGYYEQAYGKSGYALKTALHQIIRDHASLSYDALWDAFRTTDVREDGYVWDMYSDCDFRFGSNQCGNYKQEGDCYNREHSFPKSWFDDARPMYTDLFHLYPTDGYVNGRRGNNPFGEVDEPTYTSQAGCRLGPNATPGYSGTVFEPLDEYKGDFARTYFYMATCYEDRIADWGSCPICNGTDGQAFDDWVVDLLLQWHEQDPVSDKERERNDAVYVYQENRNPFIDYPELVEKIWGEDNTPFGPENPDPDPEPEPLPDSLPSYYVAYRYVNDSGMVVASDTLHLVPLEAEYGGSLHSLFGASGLRKVEDSVLIEEGFSGMEGSDRGSETPELEATDGYVAAFEGAVYAMNHAVRLSSSKNSGTVVFKEMAVSDSISVRISGRGWDEDELTFTIECQGGTPAQRQLSFSGSDQMETLDPVSFAVDGAFVLRVHADAKQRVFLDEVLVKTGAAGDSIAPDPEPDPEPNPGSDTASYLSVLYPLAADTLYGDSVVARIRIARLPDSLHLNGAYALAPAWLPDSAAYWFCASLWCEDSCLQKDSVPFVLWNNALTDSVPGSGPDTVSVQGLAERLDFRMYPNPTTAEVVLGLPSVGKIEVYAVSGQRIRDLEADSDEVVLRLSRSGIYFIRFVSREGIAVKRLLVL